MADDIVSLNVGGTFYTTTRSTLRRFSGSMLHAMFSGAMPSTIDSDGRYFIDRDGRMFQYILNYLRSTKLSLPKDFDEFDSLIAEVDFFQIDLLYEEIVELRLNLIRKSTALTEARFLEIIEVRTGSIATMPTNNSRVKTILSGRKHVIMMLPVIGDLPESQLEKLHCYSQDDYTEIVLQGSNIRLRLGEHLKSNRWELIDANMSTSSTFDPKGNASGGSVTVEHSFRDRWYLPASSLLD